MMEIEFLCTAGEVTGSCYLIRCRQHRILLECGQIQGNREAEALNREPFSFDPGEIDAVILSHAHIDHSGRLPLLVKQGYGGPVHTHHATRELCTIMLRDSAWLHEKDAETENRKRARRGMPSIEPLYTREHAEEVMHLFRGYEYGERIALLPGIELRLRDAGHILGAAIVEIWLEEHGVKRKVVFSGDLGFEQA